MALDPVTAILNVGNSLIDRLLPDKAQNDAAKAQLLSMQVAGELAQIQGQIDTNKAEATNVNMFVAGWRPFVGWVCGVALGWDTIVRPTITWGAALFGHPLNLQPLDLSTLLPLLLGMLGLGAARTVEKLSGVNAGH